jgi:hypothetical protein
MRIEQGKRQDGWMLMDAPKIPTEPSEQTSIRESLTQNTAEIAEIRIRALPSHTIYSHIQTSFNLQHLAPKLIKEEL